MPVWTPPQSEAIYTRDCNLLVAAAAGSGKTAVLVERILSLLDEGQNLDSMLIVTFTNAAAAEMKERISQALISRLAQPNPPAHLQNQLAALPRTQISTLSSFCARLVREYFYAADVDASFRVGTEAECAVLRAQALEETLDQLCDQEDTDTLSLLSCYGEPLTQLEDILLALYHAIQSQPYPLEWLNEAVEMPVALDAPWANFLASTVTLRLEQAMEQYAHALNLCDLPGGPTQYKEALSNELAELSMAQEQARLGLAQAIRGIAGFTYRKLPGKRGGDVDLRERAKAYRDTAKELVKDLLYLGMHSPEEWLAEMQQMQPCARALCRYIARFTQLYGDKKTEEGVLDFNDLEHLAIKALARDDVAEDVRATYAYIFVDEYQDSNGVQETILSRIARPDNRFYVGDVKQSIYRFRLADPTLFLLRYRHKSPTGKDRVIDLNQNFRSQSLVLHGVNRVFSRVMQEEVGEIEYNEQAYLYPGRVDSASGHPIELHLIEKKPPETLAPDAPQALPDAPANNQAAEAGRSGFGDPDELSQALTEEEIRLVETVDAQTEALVVVERIRALLGSPIPDGKGGTRPLTYGDMVILMRSTQNHGENAAKILNQLKIPALLEPMEDYFQGMEVMTALNLLRVIDNPRQDIPLIGVLRHVQGLTTEELARIRLCAPSDREHTVSFYEAVQACMEQTAEGAIQKPADGASEPADGASELTDATAQEQTLGRRLRAFFEALGRWRKRAVSLAPDDAVWMALYESGYYEQVALMPLGETRQANLRLLIQYAQEYAGTARASLSGFLRFVDRLSLSGVNLSPAGSMETTEAVRIMTIHKSKGLEFPVVFVMGLGRRFNTRDESGSVLTHRAFGLALEYIDPAYRVRSTTLKREALVRKMHMESIAEEMRVLYVALTRARERLILIGSQQNLYEGAEKWRELKKWHVADARKYLDWIVPCVINHPDGEELRLLLEDEGQSIPAEPDESKWQVCIHDKLSLLSALPDAVEEPKADLPQVLQGAWAQSPVLPDWLEGAMSFVYPHKDVERGGKLTVSGIATVRGNVPLPGETSDEQEWLKKMGALLMPVQEPDIALGTAAFRASLKPQNELADRPRFMQEKGLTPAERGTLMHTMLLRLPRELGLEPDASKLRQRIRGYVQDFQREGRLSSPEAVAVDVEGLAAFYGSEYGKRMAGAETCYLEKPFNVYLPVYGTEEMPLVQGAIDACWLEGDEWVLLDYKTDRIFPSLAEVLERHKAQLRLYAMALERLTGKGVKERIVYLLTAHQGYPV